MHSSWTTESLKMKTPHAIEIIWKTNSGIQTHITEHRCGNIKSHTKLYLWTELQATVKIEASRPVKTKQAASLVSYGLPTVNLHNIAVVTLNNSLQSSHPRLFLRETECHDEHAATWPAGSSWTHLNLMTTNKYCYTLLLHKAYSNNWRKRKFPLRMCLTLRKTLNAHSMAAFGILCQVKKLTSDTSRKHPASAFRVTESGSNGC